MEKDVVDDTSGHFRRLLVAQIQGGRDESKTFDRTAAQDDAQALFKAGEAKWGTDESMWALTVLTVLSIIRLNLIFLLQENLHLYNIHSQASIAF